MLLSIVVYQHQLRSLQWIGVAIVFVGLFIEMRAKQRQAKAKQSYIVSCSHPVQPTTRRRPRPVQAEVEVPAAEHNQTWVPGPLCVRRWTGGIGTKRGRTM